MPNSCTTHAVYEVWRYLCWYKNIVDMHFSHLSVIALCTTKHGKKKFNNIVHSIQPITSLSNDKPLDYTK